MALWLAEHTSPEAASRACAGSILAVPLGSTEQHGPHLPLSTDTDIASTLCDVLADARDDVVVAPPLPYGSSGEHAAFAGTLSIGHDALEFVLVELVRSATRFFPRVVLVSAHGGNHEPVLRAVARLRGESRDVLLFEPRWSGDAHAGCEETSLQLAMRPGSVRMERAVVGNVRPLRELLPVLRERGVAAVSPNGVLGDATVATVERGRALLRQLSDQLVHAVDEWHSP